MVGTTVKIQIFVRHDMESEVDNIGKVARLVIGVGFGFKNRVQNRFSEASEPRIVKAQKPNF